MIFMSSSACSNTQRSKVTFDHTYVRDRANMTPSLQKKKKKQHVQYKGVVLLFFFVCF